MRHNEFHIGGEFLYCGDVWRCTDVGTRTVVAIRIGFIDTTVLSRGGRENHHLTQAQAEAEGWFEGPPYAVVECLFDENEMPLCEPAESDTND